MDTAERDQWKAGAEEWWWQMQTTMDLALAHGFSREEAITLMMGSFEQGAGQSRGQGYERLLQALQQMLPDQDD